MCVCVLLLCVCVCMCVCVCVCLSSGHGCGPCPSSTRAIGVTFFFLKEAVALKINFHLHINFHPFLVSICFPRGVVFPSFPAFLPPIYIVQTRFRPSNGILSSFVLYPPFLFSPRGRILFSFFPLCSTDQSPVEWKFFFSTTIFFPIFLTTPPPRPPLPRSPSQTLNPKSSTLNPKP